MSVGQEITTFCSSCKLSLKHVIVAHKSGNSGPVAKVRCNTCMKIHSFRNPPAPKSAGGGRRASPAPRERPAVIPIEVEWREQLSKLQGVASQAYAPTKEFKAGDVIEHPSFGCGVVKSLKDGNKLEALFQKDVKTLAHRLKEA